MNRQNMQKKKYQYKNDKKIMLFILWLILLIHMMRYFFIILGKSDPFAFINNEQKKWNFIELFSRFSKQSTFLIFIIITLKLFKKKNKKFFLYISFIGLIDIILSCLVYNIIINRFDALKNFYKNYQFLSIDYVEHVYIPFFYLIFFLFSNIKNISLKKIYISFIHPFLYFMIFITIGIYDKNFDKYPYSFMDPKRGKCLLKFVYNVEPKGWIGVGINFLLIALIIYLLSYFLIKIKNIFLKK